MTSTRTSDLVVLSNRLPVSGRASADGRVEWVRAAGGLVATLEPVLRRRPSTWIGWSGLPAELGCTFGGDVTTLDSCRLVDVPLSRELVDNHYHGFANTTLWPLYHGTDVRAQYDRRWWDAYVVANRAFASRAAEVAGERATVWVHDSQLQLVPRMLRETRRDLRIGFFLHIPFPPTETYASLPWRREVLEGLLGADLIGFQTRESRDCFTAAVSRILGRRIDGDRVLPDAESHGRGASVVGVFPASIDVEGFDAASRGVAVIEAAAQFREELGAPRRVLLGVDRLDYTKGIDVRIEAYRRLLERRALDPRETVLVQVATPTRQPVPGYAEVRDRVACLVGRTLGEHGYLTSVPLRYVNGHLGRTELAALYRAADVMVVTPFRDGMNLVCKEYVACRTTTPGALVLSEFAGAAAELGGQAFTVNPYDLDSVERGILAAARAPEGDLRSRMDAMRSWLVGHDVHAWAATYLDTLASCGSA